MPPSEGGDWVGVDGQGKQRQMEAEKWRGDGYFKRGEVNVTRAGEMSRDMLPVSSRLGDPYGRVRCGDVKVHSPLSRVALDPGFTPLTF
jgi:hypothetical protein